MDPGRPEGAARRGGRSLDARGIALLAATLAVVLASFPWWSDAVASETLGSLSADGSPTVAFDDIASREFDALAVDRNEGPPSDRALVVRVDLRGPVPDLRAPEAWLEENGGIRVVHDPDGVPVVFVDADLTTERGAEALGAAIPRGIAIEVRDPALVPCVYAHELLHFLGLHHVDDPDDLMFARCGADKPDGATLGRESLDELGRLRSIEALSLTGRDVWAERS